MTEIYRKAFTEVYEIINYLDDNDYNKIPKEVIEAIKENRNQEYEYFLDESIQIADQKMLPETKAILFNFFRDYWSTKDQKEKIVNFQITQRAKLEEEKKNKFNEVIFEKKDKKMVLHEYTDEKSLIKVERNKFYFKLIDFFKRIMNRD